MYHWRCTMVEKLFEQKCPNCGSDDLEYDIIEPEGETMKQYITCNACGLGLHIFSDTKWVYDTDWR